MRIRGKRREPWRLDMVKRQHDTRRIRNTGQPALGAAGGKGSQRQTKKALTHNLGIRSRLRGLTFLASVSAVLLARIVDDQGAVCAALQRRLIKLGVQVF